MSEFFTVTATSQYFIFATALISLIVSLSNAWQSRKRDKSISEIHISLNSRLTELNERIARASHAEGVLQGKADEKANPS